MRSLVLNLFIYSRKYVHEVTAVGKTIENILIASSSKPQQSPSFKKQHSDGGLESKVREGTEEGKTKAQTWDWLLMREERPAGESACLRD